MRIKFKDFTGLLESFMRNDATVPRTWQFPDKDMTVAGLDDVQASQAAITLALDDMQEDLDWVMIQSFKSLHKY